MPIRDDLVDYLPLRPMFPLFFFICLHKISILLSFLVKFDVFAIPTRRYPLWLFCLLTDRLSVHPCPSHSLSSDFHFFHFWDSKVLTSSSSSFKILQTPRLSRWQDGNQRCEEILNQVNQISHEIGPVALRTWIPSKSLRDHKMIPHWDGTHSSDLIHGCLTILNGYGTPDPSKSDW
jgi:hypothetical protein